MASRDDVLKLNIRQEGRCFFAQVGFGQPYPIVKRGTIEASESLDYDGWV